ncbi:MAG TPA: serine/threonine-protein kinase, partial [Gemmatimonadales bacterium]|nr:serine/threonine-protein kinase [Gemmatimonadales bacterium]
MSSTPEQYGFDHPSHSNLESRVRAALAGRYAVERRIGSGGMATVYLAEDARHQRQVAVKVLRVELASALGSERFLREIRIAAKLQHPHILPLLDSGEADGLLYYVMPFVQGESLRQRLQREGSLSIPDAVRILRDVTDALAYAHAQNVVHRDVKPDNVMLSGRHAVLMDFGVAKAVSQAAQEGGTSTLTTRGLSIGTPAYMAPEQALADPQLDHRVDIYAAGVVAYELLAGVLPFDATTPEAMLSAHVTQKPLLLTGRREGIPAALAELVMRCL